MKVSKAVVGLFLVALMCAMPYLGAKDRVLGTTYNVEFYTVNRFDNNGHNYGVDLYAQNNNNRPMRVTISMTNGSNVTQNLLPGWFTLNPNQNMYLGTITQVDMSQPYNWYVQWTVSYQ